MPPLRELILVVQLSTFMALGALLCSEGLWQLGFAQLLLAAVQWLVYQ